MASAPSVREGTRSFAVMQALKILSAFGIATLVARQLGADGKGGLALLQQTPSIMALVMGFGFAGVSVYFVGSGKKTPAEALADSLLVALVGLVAGVPISFALMWAIPAIREFSPMLILVAVLIVPVSVLTAQVAGILVGAGRPERQARAQSVALILNVAVVAALYFRVRLTVGAVVVTSLAASVVALVIMLVWLGERPHFAGAASRIRSASAYARKRYLTDVAAMLEMRVDIVMLGVLSTVAATGVYSVAVSLVELLWFIPRAAEAPLLSRLLHEHPETGIDLVAVSVRITVLVEALLLAGAALLLKPAVALVFGPAFTGAPLLFWILVPGVVMNGLCGPVVSYLTSRGHQYPKLAAVSVAGNVALNALFIPLIGVAGAALASSLTYGIGGVWLFSRFMSETGCPLSALIVPRRGDLSALLGSRAR